MAALAITLKEDQIVLSFEPDRNSPNPSEFQDVLRRYLKAFDKGKASVTLVDGKVTGLTITPLVP